MNLIKLENIKKEYDLWSQKINVLKWINLTIDEWDFVSIMGQSGSWKSTLMNIIWMLDNPTSWNYILKWKNISNYNDDEQALIRRNNIWFIFQSYNLIPKISAIHQVMLPLIYQWIKDKKKLAIDALKKVWLWDKIYNLPSELSWWQQQRVAIARCLVTNPLIILWDEPTWALDSKTWDEIMELLSALNNEWKTIIIITHAHEVDRFAKIHINIKDWQIIN